MTAADTLFADWAELKGIGSAIRVLSWDQETKMPAKGQSTRGRAMSVLVGLHHDKMTSPALAETVEAAGVEADESGDSLLTDHVDAARRDIVRAAAIPGALARKLAELESRAMGAWQEAKAADDFSLFAPTFREVIDLTREQADALVAAGIAGSRYDALLDDYEPGANEAQLVELFGGLRGELTPLVKAVADSGITIDESSVRGTFSEDAQLALGRFAAETIGYDFDAGRLDTSAHPFTAGFGEGDVRITWRPESDDFRPGLFGILHESGHAMYEQGIPADIALTPLGEPVSLGIHESQSRLWENQVGRSRAFLTWALPSLRERLPGMENVTVDQLFPALNTLTPSLIRTEADEGTYNLHVIARFEMERKIVSGEVGVDDLPDLWADTYDDLLGIRPTSMADGVLQDVHWAVGAFGYFPTYTLGNLAAAQLFAAADNALDDLTGSIATGDFSPLLGWLRENVHRHGRRIGADALIEQATGAPLSPQPFLDHLRARTAEVYGVTV